MSQAGPSMRTRVIASVLLVGIVTGASTALADRRDLDVVGTRTLMNSGPEVWEAAPDIDAPASILVTMDGQTLWARNPDEERAIASTTKVMTCLVALEELRPDDRVIVSARAAAVGGSGIYFVPGEERTAEELLLAMMLESSNAAAAALAEHIAGSEAAFVEMMNVRASSLGMEHTAFRNPHGLDVEGHYSSAADLASLTRAAMQVRALRDLVSQERATIPGPNGERELENSNELIADYDGAIGVKTGWTTPAGYCLVAAAKRDSVELVAVVLGTARHETRFSEARHLLDWGFEHYSTVEVASVEETIASVQVDNYMDRKVVARIGEGASVPVLDIEGPIWREYEVLASVTAPLDAGDALGVLRAYQGERLLAEVPLVADEDVPEPDLWEKVRVFFFRLWDRWFKSG